MSAYPGFTDGDLQRQLKDYRRRWRYLEWSGLTDSEEGQALAAEIGRLLEEMKRRQIS